MKWQPKIRARPALTLLYAQSQFTGEVRGSFKRKNLDQYDHGVYFRRASAVRELSAAVMAQEDTADARLRVTEAMNSVIAVRNALSEHRRSHGC